MLKEPGPGAFLQRFLKPAPGCHCRRFVLNLNSLIGIMPNQGGWDHGRYRGEDRFPCDV
jgi:hypothetical protein